MGESGPYRTSTPSWIEWGVAARSLAGQINSGDRHLVAPLPNGILIAVIDGLGHGDDAAAAAERAVSTLREYAGEPVLRLLQTCHKALQETRGVVMSLASIDATNNTLCWAGAGDVEGVLIRADASAAGPREYVPLRGGVVGYRLPPITDATLPIGRGDTLAFATDGIRREFAEGLAAAYRDPPQQAADRILAQYAKQTDDSLVLVARYLGGAL